MAVNDLSKVFGIPSPTGTLDLTPQFQTSPATGTLGLEQPSTLQRAGSRISNNLARMGGYDPMQLSNAEQRKQARLAGLQELSYRLSQTAAKLSGDPARMQIAQQQEAQRIEARQDQFKKRQIVEGVDGFKYYVNPDGSFERVFPGLEKASTPSSIEILQMVDENDNFIRNITEEDFVKEQQSGTLPKGAKLTRLPTDTKTAQTKQLTKKSDIFISPEIKPFEKQYDATIQLVNAIQSTADQMYKEPTAALAAGGLFQFVDALEQNVRSVIGEYAKINEDLNFDYEQQQKSGTFIAHDTKRDFGKRIKEISGGNAVLESKIRDLAYLFAASRGQEGRGLSDKDYENALRIVSGGVGAEGRVKVLGEVANRISEDVTLSLQNQKKRLNYRSERMPDRKEDFDKYITEIDSIFATPLPSFADPFMQQQTPPPTTGGSNDVQRIRIEL
jgi:hypothetical protein